MTNRPRIRKFTAGEWKTYQNIRLQALADSPDAFGTTLSEAQERSDAEWSHRLASGANSDRDLPLLAEVDGHPAGLAWGHIEEADRNVAYLFQMWVAPGYRRLGIGQMLVETVIAWGREKGASFLELGVTYRDSPAMRLYRRAGFEPAGKLEPVRPGSELLSQQMRLILRRP